MQRTSVLLMNSWKIAAELTGATRAWSGRHGWLGHTPCTKTKSRVTQPLSEDFENLVDRSEKSLNAMYRQHPYAGYAPPDRRGGSPGGPGPDRSRPPPRGGRGPRGRGRGGSGHFQAPTQDNGYASGNHDFGPYSDESYQRNGPSDDYGGATQSPVSQDFGFQGMRDSLLHSPSPSIESNA